MATSTRASYSIPGAPRCSLAVSRVCGQVAAELLLVSRDGKVWESFPRCPDHPARDHVPMLTRVHPGASWVIITLPRYGPVTTESAATQAR